MEGDEQKQDGVEGQDLITKRVSKPSEQGASYRHGLFVKACQRARKSFMDELVELEVLQAENEELDVIPIESRQMACTKLESLRKCFGSCEEAHKAELDTATNDHERMRADQNRARFMKRIGDRYKIVVDFVESVGVPPSPEKDKHSADIDRLISSAVSTVSSSRSSETILNFDLEMYDLQMELEKKKLRKKYEEEQRKLTEDKQEL